VLSEEETRQRAAFYYCAGFQLKMLMRNDFLRPEEYLTILERSSLKLAEDEIIRTTIEEGVLSGSEDGGVYALITLFEGFLYALCEVLEIDADSIAAIIPAEFLATLSDEMNAGRSSD
jgi:hypothetical protein